LPGCFSPAASFGFFGFFPLDFTTNAKEAGGVSQPLWNAFVRHLTLVGVAVSLAALFAVPLGIACSGKPRLAAGLLYVNGLIMTIPSVALYGLMMPILALVGRGIGVIPALIALFLYSQLPMLRNTIVGLRNVDPAIVDEMGDEARLSGHPLLPRKSLSHALNIRMVAYKAASELGRPLSGLNMVVLHLGSGVSVNAIRGGRMIDTNNANDGGPFSSQRTGSLPVTGLIDLCFSGSYDRKQHQRMFLKEGGLMAYLGIDHVGEACVRASNGDAGADLALRAMVYQFVKEGGAMAAALHGDVDCVVITGGMAHNGWVVEEITKGLSFLGRVMTFPGEAELEALVRGVLRVLDGVEEVRTYN